jgi:hypothetical protein
MGIVLRGHDEKRQRVVVGEKLVLTSQRKVEA